MSTPTKTEVKVIPKAEKIDPKELDRPTGLGGLQRIGEAAILPQLAKALPGLMREHANRMLRCLYTECQKNVALLECTPRSLFGGLIQVAQLGLELGGPAGHAYLLPFGKKKEGVTEATLCIGYKGFIQLAYRAGVANFTPRTVFEGDAYSIEYGTRHELRHVPAFQSTKAIGYYAIVKTPAGGVDFEYLTYAQAEDHRQRYALSKEGPWKTAFDEMAKKTAIRKLAKRVPLSVEWVAAATLDEMADEGVPQQLAAAVVLEGEQTEQPKAGLRERLDQTKKPTPQKEVEKDEHGNPIWPEEEGASGSLFGDGPKTKLPD
jgi:recombination protein RecT